MVKVSASIMSADFSILREEVNDICAAGADMLHIDVMDGHFVPNITFGPFLLKTIKSINSTVTLDVHLMIENAPEYVDEFISAGADIITVHYESVTHLRRLLLYIKSKGVKAGVALVPSTPPEFIDYILDVVDLIVVMTVDPGFGGQSFINSQLDKISKIKDKISNCDREIMIEVDGGINGDTAPLVNQAGVDILVSGSYIFSSGKDNYSDKILSLKQSL